MESIAQRTKGRAASESVLKIATTQLKFARKGTKNGLVMVARLFVSEPDRSFHLGIYDALALRGDG